MASRPKGGDCAYSADDSFCRRAVPTFVSGGRISHAGNCRARERVGLDAAGPVGVDVWSRNFRVPRDTAAGRFHCGSVVHGQRRSYFDVGTRRGRAISVDNGRNVWSRATADGSNIARHFGTIRRSIGLNTMGIRRKSSAAGDGRFAYDGLDRAIHEKARLGILTALVAHPEGVAFNDLKELCSLTDGNLNRHLAVLEEERLVTTNRDATRGRPQTVVVISRRPPTVSRLPECARTSIG